MKVYFCADDYGISQAGNVRIEQCLNNGALNKVSVLPNGEIDHFKQQLSETAAVLSLHLNLVEGYPLSEPADVDLLISDSGQFRYSFIGLLFMSLSPKRAKMKKQLYNEIQSQVRFWKEEMGEKTPMSIDSHQHTHMIPLVFKTLMRVIKDEGVCVENIRIPAEPIAPYLFTPSMYGSYSLSGIAKQWVLKVLALIDHREIRKAKIPYAYFMGVLFSGKLEENKIKKILPRYIKLAEKNNKDIEIGLHPGYVEKGEKLMRGSREGFKHFYFSPMRRKEYDALMHISFE